LKTLIFLLIFSFLSAASAGDYLCEVKKYTQAHGWEPVTSQTIKLGLNQELELYEDLGLSVYVTEGQIKTSDERVFRLFVSLSIFDKKLQRAVISDEAPTNSEVEVALYREKIKASCFSRY
jgi:hypothetical protein